jgi:hypothetical protein
MSESTAVADPGASPDEPGMSQSVSDQLDPTTRLEKALALVPRALSSHVHIIFLGLLGIYLVILPLLGVNVSAKSELIGGNYTNVTSDLGACIAAGLTVHLVRRERRRAQRLEQFERALHLRHDALEKSVADAVAAARGAEAAAKRAGGAL